MFSASFPLETTARITELARPLDAPGSDVWSVRGMVDVMGDVLCTLILAGVLAGPVCSYCIGTGAGVLEICADAGVSTSVLLLFEWRREMGPGVPTELTGAPDI